MMDNEKSSMTDADEKNSGIDAEDNKIQKRKLDKYGLYTVILLIFFATAIVVISLYMHSKLKEVNKDGTKYKYHFAFISKSEDSYTANHIYEEARNYGKQHGVYVEKLKTGSGTDYTDDDYVRMAAAMQVDGIILEGSDEEELKAAIDEATEGEIPTITLLSDCPGSRKSFIEIGDYNLGREYARTIINITKTRKPKVVVFVDEEAEGTERLLDGIRITLANEGNHLNVDMQIVDVAGLANFRLSDLAKVTLTDKYERPDILICVNEHDTKIVYQAVRDYNLVGNAQIIGYGVSDSLLKAVRDEEIAALIDVDAGQLGMVCVDALVNYKNHGSVSDYIIVDDTVITKDNVERYLDED
ncbi:MAG: substrate-binding domain-containing protein [Eubacterium sp.]|nr:substrate-binding domain-containing protein [Eubacterium sp.]